MGSSSCKTAVPSRRGTVPSTPMRDEPSDDSSWQDRRSRPAGSSNRAVRSPRRGGGCSLTQARLRDIRPPRLALGTPARVWLQIVRIHQLYRATRGTSALMGAGSVVLVQSSFPIRHNDGRSPRVTPAGATRITRASYAAIKNHFSTVATPRQRARDVSKPGAELTPGQEYDRRRTAIRARRRVIIK
jgi:hypothetical protein